MKIIGIDLAWATEKNTTAIAIGELSQTGFYISKIIDSVLGLDNIINIIDGEKDVTGIAVDAPLIINNMTGQRECEKALSKVYAGRRAGCHASNQTLYPNAASVRLSEHLFTKGFIHLGVSQQKNWQIEIYPHPAIIEIFNLKQRLLYKKGKVADKKQGQIELAELINSLSQSTQLKLTLCAEANAFLSATNISSKKGLSLKQNEDALDSIICAYIGALYATQVNSSIFGDDTNGYIYVPTPLL